MLNASEVRFPAAGDVTAASSEIPFLTEVVFTAALWQKRPNAGSGVTSEQPMARMRLTSIGCLCDRTQFGGLQVIDGNFQ